MRLLLALSIGLTMVACGSPPVAPLYPNVSSPFSSTPYAAGSGYTAPSYDLPADGSYTPEPLPEDPLPSPSVEASPSALPSLAPLDASEDDEEAAPAANVPIDNFHEVAEDIYRGARPTEEGLAQLQAMGVKTVINLEWSNKIHDQEKALVEALGMRSVHIPMNVITPPSTTKVEQFHAILSDPNSLPVFFHCKQGRDRTGLMAYTYRVKLEGWDHKSAYEEAKGYGFRTYLLGLRGFMYWYGKKFGA